MDPYDRRGSGPQRVTKSTGSRITLYFLFCFVAAGTVGAGFYLAKFAPREEMDTAATGTPLRRRTASTGRGKSDAASPLSSLQRSVQAIRQHQKDMEELLPDEDPKKHKDEPDPSEDLFKGGKSLSDYTKMMMDAVKSLTSFTNEVSP